MKNNDIDLEIMDRMIRMQLQNARKSAGLSQIELSNISGMSKMTIYRIENDYDYTPTLQSIIKYANSLGYDFTITKSLLVRKENNNETT